MGLRKGRVGIFDCQFIFVCWLFYYFKIIKVTHIDKKYITSTRVTVSASPLPIKPQLASSEVEFYQFPLCLLKISIYKACSCTHLVFI